MANARLEIPDGKLLHLGTVTGAGIRFIYQPANKSLFIGNATGSQWDGVGGTNLCWFGTNGVPSGAYSFVNGSNVLGCGSYNVIIGGPTAVGGVEATTYGLTIANGATVRGSYSIVVGADIRWRDQFAGNNNIIIGQNAYCDQGNSLHISLGQISTRGDKQFRKIVFSGQTTNDTATVIGNIETYNNRAYGCKTVITGKQAGGSTNMAMYEIDFASLRGANASSLVKKSEVKTTVHEDDANWDANIVMDTTGGQIRIQVTGIAGTTINWIATLEVIEIGQ